MPRYLIKPDPGRDLYVEWSTIVDAPIGHGTRAEWLGEGADPTRLDRADRTGTSAYRPLDIGAWDDEELMVAEPLGCQRILPRDHLIAYAQALYRRRVDDAYAMTRAIEEMPQLPESAGRRRAVRTHRRRCPVCNPAGNPPPLPVDGHAYARRRRTRSQR
jgi:hypothetical protein